MPLFIPLLVGGVSVLAGIVGLCELDEANETRKRAVRIVKDTEDEYEGKKDEYEYTRYLLNEKTESLNKLINKINKKIIPELQDLMQQIGERRELNLEFVRLNKQLYSVLADRNSSITVSKGFFDIISSIATGAALGAGTPTMLTGIAVSIGTASTGTAISAISGVAANNAALAWLGGGALSAGGAGVAGGLAVTGIATLGVGVLIGGITLNAKAQKALTEAEKYSGRLKMKVKRLDKEINDMYIKRGKIEYYISLTEKVTKTIRLFINGVDKHNVTKDDVKRVMNASVMLHKYIDIITMDIKDKNLSTIKHICESKINEAERIIDTLV